MAIKDENKSEYVWETRDGNSRSRFRKLSGTKRMFVLLNQEMFGQNCPFIGATISLHGHGLPGEQKKFSFGELQKRAVDAFCQTRWKYPTVGGRVVNGDTALYEAESNDEVEAWAKRTVTIIDYDGGLS